MERTFAALAVIHCLTIGASAQELSRDDSVFLHGFNAGLMAKYEGEVVDAFTGLTALGELAEAQTYRTLLVTRMNSALYQMSFVDSLISPL